MSTAPSWDGSGLTARPVGLRVFLVSSGGGYSRHARRADPGFARHRRFSSPCNTAAAARTPGSRPGRPSRKPRCCTLRTRTWTCAARATICRSRLADNFFWLGRYSERADETARLLRSTLRRFNPERTGSAMPLAGAAAADARKAGPVAGTAGEDRVAPESRGVRGGIARGHFRSGAHRQPAQHGGPFAAAGHVRARPHLQRHVARPEPAQRTPGHAGRPAWSCSRAMPPRC